MAGMKQSTSIGFWVFVLSVLAVAVALDLTGCGVTPPLCQTAGEYRCNDNTAEMCDGNAWNPRFQCEECGTDGSVAWCE
jgi:hypothetical protein